MSYWVFKWLLSACFQHKPACSQIKCLFSLYPVQLFASFCLAFRSWYWQQEDFYWLFKGGKNGFLHKSYLFRRWLFAVDWSKHQISNEIKPNLSVIRKINSPSLVCLSCCRGTDSLSEGWGPLWSYMGGNDKGAIKNKKKTKNMTLSSSLRRN